MLKPLAVAALSGGLDSCVTTAIALQKYDLALLHVNYGQRTESRELQAFHDIAAHYNIKKKLIVDFDYLVKIGGSSLTDHNLKITRADLLSTEIPNSYVPFRNANILSVGVSWAEAIGAEAIFVGAVHEDSSGYPDCRPEFFEAFEKMAALGTKPSTNIKIMTPIITYSKTDIVIKGMELGAPLHLTWSCYQSEDEACGECDSCALRLRGFHNAGYEDPINYKIRPIYT